MNIRTRSFWRIWTMKGRNKIYEFNPAVYPFRLWVGMDVSPKDIKEKFWAWNIGDDTISDIMDNNLSLNNVAATTYPVCYREDNWIGAFVHIRGKGKCSVGVIAHEASHVCDLLSDRLGLVGEIDKMFSHGEARAYFIEWVANCINQVKTGKMKD